MEEVDYNYSFSNFEEIAENYIEERWGEIEVYMKQFFDWKESAMERVSNIEKDTEEIKSVSKDFFYEVNARIEKYELSMTDMVVYVKVYNKILWQLLRKFNKSMETMRKLEIAPKPEVVHKKTKKIHKT